MTEAVEVADEERVERPEAVKRALLERLMLGEPLPVLLGVEVLMLVAAGVEVLLTVAVELTEAFLEAPAVAVAVLLPLRLTLTLAEDEVLGEVVVDREAEGVAAPERLRLEVLEVLREACSVRDSVAVVEGVRSAEAVNLEAELITVTLVVRETVLLAERLRVAALEGSALKETESVWLL